MFGPAVIIGLRHRCSSTVKPAVSPFNTLTLMSVAHCRVQTWHPLSLCHYVKRVTCRIEAAALGGGGGALIAWDAVDLCCKENTLWLQLIVPLHWQDSAVDGMYSVRSVILFNLFDVSRCRSVVTVTLLNFMFTAEILTLVVFSNITNFICLIITSWKQLFDKLRFLFNFFYLTFLLEDIHNMPGKKLEKCVWRGWKESWINSLKRKIWPAIRLLLFAA